MKECLSLKKKVVLPEILAIILTWFMYYFLLRLSDAQTALGATVITLAAILAGMKCYIADSLLQKDKFRFWISCLAMLIFIVGGIWALGLIF